jgi:pSer/pThr/pTyr-binding forkhead associated (FHA) protein
MLAIFVLLLRILMLAALFSFLGWTIYTLWRDLNFQSQALTLKKVPYISVHREGSEADAKQIFTQSELRIGRDPSSEVQISDDTVSTHHARLWYRNKQWWVEDLLSTNGTFLNDEKVETPTILISGDELRVGKVLLTIEIQPVE